MNCERFEALLTDYLEGTLTKEEMAEMEQHVQTCPACTQSLRDMRMLLQDLASLDESAQVPAQWQHSWRQAIHQEEMKQMQADTQKRKPWRAWVSAAAAIVVLTAGSLAARDLVPATAIPDMDTAAQRAGMIQEAEDGYGAAGWAMENSTGSSLPAPYAAADMGMMTAKSTGYSPEGVAGSGESATPEETVQGVKIIRTASYSLASMLFEKDLDAVKALAASLNGWVEYSSVSGDAARGEMRYASLTLRVPTGALDTFKESVQQIGRVTGSDESATDVSERYSDTHMRLATQKEKMARLQKLMETAGELGDLLAVENEIANTQYQIDSYESSLKGMDSRIDFTSIHINLREETAGEAAAVKTLTLAQRIQKGLAATIKALGQFAQDAVVFLAMVLPAALPLALVTFLVVLWRKRRKQTKQS